MFDRIVLALSLGVLPAFAAPASAQVVEDFESYESTPDLASVWEFATELDTTTPNPGPGSKSLRLQDDVGPFGGLFSTNTFDEPIDLSGVQVSVWIRRDPASVTPTNVLIDFGDDSAGGCSTGFVPITGSAWQRLILDLDSCGSLDAAAVAYVSLSASNPSDSSGTLAANFDDIGVFVFVDGFESGGTTRWSIALP